MLAECKTHGYYRGESCPICGDEGKFLLSDEELDHIGRLMAGALRHFPERLGLQMDDHGWVDLQEFANTVRNNRYRMHWFRPHHLEAIVDTDPKGRYQIWGGKIRATYAHTVQVDTSDLPIANCDELFYPVTEEELDIVLEQGLRPTDRKQLHLSGTIENALSAGKVRTEDPVILGIDVSAAREDGISIRRAGKTVYVADRIDARHLHVIDPSGYATPAE
ncbi:MAG: RNA 2'-phosphotransferase [Thermoplasmata archaeon HGW-Thermoplasmata-1]|nr:MAG: RNA 2'-phosphotransferase [Thermoplasmata archaeon HGW-Thermoplasmata-1]